MAITDELREYTEEQIKWLDMTKVHYRKLFAIADRIDAEHAEAQRRWMAELDAARDRDGFIELPKDADGEYIHIGDWMENGERVERIVLTDGSWEPYVYLAKTPYVLHEYFCNEISHYRQPTVEDVLRKFALACEDAGNAGPEVGRLAAEYAAKLREMLAGDGE